MKRITLTPSAPNNNAGRLPHPNALVIHLKCGLAMLCAKNPPSVTIMGIIAGSAARLRWKYVE